MGRVSDAIYGVKLMWSEGRIDGQDEGPDECEVEYDVRERWDQ